MRQYDNDKRFSSEPGQFALKPAESGFTLMEIVVATTIFALVVVALTSLFNYTMRISRKADALRQATQGMRSFSEYLAKEIRNGKIDYGVTTGISGNNVVASQNGVCPVAPGGTGNTPAGPTYQSAGNNTLGIITPEGDRECFYYGKADNSYAGAGVFQGSLVNPPATTLVIVKNNQTAQSLSPANFTIDQLAFYIRPIQSPYLTPVNTTYLTQPLVTIMFKATVKLPTGETVTIPYQTTVSTDKYDIPTN